MILLPGQLERTVRDGRDPETPGLSGDRLRTLFAYRFTDSQRGTLPVVASHGLAFWRGLRHSEKPTEGYVYQQADPCERVIENHRPIDTREMDGVVVLISALLNMGCKERKDFLRSQSDSVDYSYESEVENIDTDKRVYVRILIAVNGENVGDVVQTTEPIARKWAAHSQAKVITENEAEAWAEARHQRRGGWMDDPAWIKFRDNYKRLCRAVAA